MTKIKIALMDEHALIIDGMTLWINSFDNMRVLWTATNGEEALHKIEARKSKPDLLILDLNMPQKEDEELIHLVKKKQRGLKVIVLSRYNSPLIVSRLIRFGADCYLEKTCQRPEIEHAINQTYRHGQYFNAYVMDVLKSNLFTGQGREYGFCNIRVELKEFELKVIRLICEELTNVQIADRLCRSVRTIETVRMKIMEKIGAKNVAGVVKYALMENLVSL